jgi:hypothetical protein
MALKFGKALAGSLVVWLFLTTLDFAAVQTGFDPFIRPGVKYAAPFSGDERLHYEVNWKPMFLLPAFKAGELGFTTEETTYSKRPVFRVSARVKSSGRLASVAGLEVEDYFESIFDRDTFKSYRLVKRIREGKRQRDVELVFDYTQDQLVLKEADVGVTPVRELRNQTIPKLAEPLVDIVSVFYVGRLRVLETGSQYFVNLVDEGASRRIEILVAKHEDVTTPIGKFRTIRINTNGKIFNSGGNLRVWYSTDAARVPVKFEADVAFGKVYGTLVSMDTPNTSRGLIRTGTQH